ncbi:hypothetical protein G4B88_004401 [Cannabis sativa]|uniref:Transposase Tnp1/En/Spm-like domain-containing protein n=1 Tax=Cannabis sativa TaxID=3483 RepID=A0A7J6I1K4_CANSA|nr:hypothetical protein G4B88_004401 [Cannabis sativa]
MPLTLKKRSATNKASRSQKKYNHTTGTKSFAQIRDAQKKNGGITPTRADMFKICYTKKDKSVTDTTKEVMVQLQEKQELNEDVWKERSMNDTFSKALNYNRDVTSSQLVGEMVNLKSVAADPETIAIGLVVSKDSSKEVGGKELGDHYSEVVVQVSRKSDKQLHDSMM